MGKNETHGGMLPRIIIYQWIASIYVTGLSMGVTVVLSRMIGPNLFGEYAFIITLASFFMIFQDFGFKTLIYRENVVATEDLAISGEQLVPAAIGHAIVVSFLLSGFVLCFPFKYKVELSMAIVCFGLQAIVAFISSEYKALGSFTREAWWRVLARTASLTGLLFFIFTNEFCLFFGGWIIGLCIVLWHSPVRGMTPRFSLGSNLPLFKTCIALMVIDLTTLMYFRCDILLLKYFDIQTVQIGQYAAIYRFLDGIILLATPIGAIWFRKFRLSLNDRQLFISQTLVMVGLMAMVAAVIFFIGTHYAEDAVLIIFGVEYAEGAFLLPWLLAALFFILPNSILTQVALAMNHEYSYALSAGIGAVVNILLNIILIPEFGTLGAVWATIVTECVLMIALIWRIVRTFGMGLRTTGN